MVVVSLVDVVVWLLAARLLYSVVHSIYRPLRASFTRALTVDKEKANTPPWWHGCGVMWHAAAKFFFRLVSSLAVVSILALWLINGGPPEPPPPPFPPMAPPAPPMPPSPPCYPPLPPRPPLPPPIPPAPPAPPFAPPSAPVFHILGPELSDRITALTDGLMDDTMQSILSEGLSWLLLVLLGLVFKWLNPFKCADAKAMPP
uniref:Uncharacterized protein n=1 Tax=Haptolina ericina TaxID=156174 RepID=A0A7S3APA5_9EUKA